MIRTLRFVCALGLTAGVVLPACGSNGGSSSTFSSGVSKNQSLGTISAGDFKILCDAFASYGSNNTPFPKSSFCKYSGPAAAFVQAYGSDKTEAEYRKTCADAVTSCESSPAGAMTLSCTKPASTCNATVGEFETCVNDSNSSFDKLVAGLPACSTLTVKDLQSFAGGGITTLKIKQPASCLTLDQKCPGGLGVPVW